MRESRRAHRVSCFVPVLCSSGRRTDRAMVLDISTRGLRLQTSRRLKVGSVVTLHYPTETTPPVAARVVWTRSGDGTYEAGIDCPAEQIFWVPILLSRMAPAKSENPPRKAGSRRKTAKRG
ncbi:MAG: PilZ domain-containing protein [Candidatus Xenobia bacterium]